MKTRTHKESVGTRPASIDVDKDWNIDKSVPAL